MARCLHSLPTTTAARNQPPPMPMNPAQHAPGTPIPPCVRHKLAACGETMSDAQWKALPPLAQQRLVTAPAATGVERFAFASLVRWLLRTFPA